MKKLNCLLFALLLCTFSCSDMDENEILIEEPSSITQMLEEFKKSHEMPETRSADFSSFNIFNIQTETYVYDMEDKMDEFGESKMMKTKDFAPLRVNIHTVEFENEGVKGFAILSDDERINRIYAYTESGQLSDTTYNIGLKAAIHDIRLVCKQDLLSYYTNADVKTRAASTRMIVQPITGLEWDQRAPYNQLANSCSSIHYQYAGKCPAGCTPVAIAQAVAYLCPPALLSKNIDGLRNVGSYFPGATTGPWVSNMAVFLRYIGTCVNISYSCTGSGARIREIRDEFNAWGIQYRYGQDVNVDISSMAYNLYKGYPHITSGFTKNPREGHAWIWEGIDCYYSSISSATQKVNIVPNSRIMVYCNWGWGRYGGNGWYTSARMEQPEGQNKPFLDDNDQLYITGTTFTVPPRGQIIHY